MSKPCNHFDDGAFGIGISGEYGDSPSFIKSLVSKGFISEAKTSLWTNQGHTNSTLTFGGTNLDAIRGD